MWTRVLKRDLPRYTSGLFSTAHLASLAASLLAGGSSGPPMHGLEAQALSAIWSQLGIGLPSGLPLLGAPTGAAPACALSDPGWHGNRPARPKHPVNSHHQHQHQHQSDPDPETAHGARSQAPETGVFTDFLLASIKTEFEPVTNPPESGLSDDRVCNQALTGAIPEADRLMETHATATSATSSQIRVFPASIEVPLSSTSASA
ncbi:unnamed protein product, partial [Protopolystoma xenopodis]